MSCDRVVTSPAEPSTIPQPTRERAGEGDQLDKEHQTDKRRRIEMKLLEGNRGELADRRLHRAEDEHGATEDAAEATEAGIPAKEGPREAEELAGRGRGVDA